MRRLLPFLLVFALGCERENVDTPSGITGLSGAPDLALDGTWCHGETCYDFRDDEVRLDAREGTLIREGTTLRIRFEDGTERVIEVVEHSDDTLVVRDADGEKVLRRPGS